jgi:biotin carboxylase
MMQALGREEILVVGYSRTLLNALAGELPPQSVLVIEEPTVAAKRKVIALAAANPAVSRVLLWEYQELGSIGALVQAETALKAARAVIPGIEYAVEAAAQLACLLGCPSAGSGAAAVFRNKLRQRQVAAEAGLRNPDFAVVHTAADALAFLSRAGSPCVIKPTARQASLGVRIVGSPAEAMAGFNAARVADEPTLTPLRGIRSEVIIERAIRGAEYSVEMLVTDGRPGFSNVTAKRVLPGAYPVELGHTVPGAGNAALGRRLAGDTARLASAAGFGNGVLHCEWIVDQDGPVLVECAARMPGDEIATLLSLAYGKPFVLAYLAVLLGTAWALPPDPASGAAIRFLTAPAGTVRRVAGTQDAASAPDVQTVKVSAVPGDRIHAVRSSWDRVGYVITRGANAAEAEASAIRAAESITVELEPTA